MQKTHIKLSITKLDYRFCLPKNGKWSLINVFSSFSLSLFFFFWKMTIQTLISPLSLSLSLTNFSNFYKNGLWVLVTKNGHGYQLNVSLSLSLSLFWKWSFGLSLSLIYIFGRQGWSQKFKLGGAKFKLKKAHNNTRHIA